MSEFPPCPECSADFTYTDGVLLNCPSCGHAWSADASTSSESGGANGERVVRDSVGNILNDGDDVVIAKTLTVKGAPKALTIGTKVKNIRLVDGDHDIDCKIPGFGPMKLKSSVVKKA